jgi:hypothetical protein
VAFTVKVEALPDEIEVGLAVMLTFGAGFELPATLPPHPVTSRASERLVMSATEKAVRQMENGMRTFLKVFSFVFK